MDILTFAVKMETDGEKFYCEQAERNKDNILHVVFRMLAGDEARHAAILRQKESGEHCDLPIGDTLSQCRNLFEGMKDFESEVQGFRDQAELYHEAVGIEKKSIDFYGGLLEKATDEEEKKLYGYLLSQEKNHFTVLSELFSHINRPNTWVESAEFGLREEY